MLRLQNPVGLKNLSLNRQQNLRFSRNLSQEVHADRGNEVTDNNENQEDTPAEGNLLQYISDNLKEILENQDLIMDWQAEDTRKLDAISRTLDINDQDSDEQRV